MPGGSLARRLAVVRRRLDQALDAATAAVPRVLSLCAGDGRDVVPVLAARGPARPARALLVERDPVLAARAAASAADAGLAGVEVRCGDAAAPATFADAVPADVALLCGIFGNVSDEDVRRVVAGLPALVVPGGRAIWTRGGGTPDRRPEICAWFTDAGCEEVAFDGAPERFGVGVHRVPAPPAAGPPSLPGPLFTFRR
ncbi:MAG TPA: methyltransferase domain-containing protein [Acidimicrobiales bacterium]